MHKSDEEDEDIMTAVAAMKQREADLQPQLPKAAASEAAEEAVGPSWSDLEAGATQQDTIHVHSPRVQPICTGLRHTLASCLHLLRRLVLHTYL